MAACITLVWVSWQWAWALAGQSACTQLTGLTSARAAACPTDDTEGMERSGLGLLLWEGETTEQWTEVIRTPSLLSFILSEGAHLYMIVVSYVALSFHMCSESIWVNSGPSSSTTITVFILHCCQRYYNNFELKKWDRQWIQRSCPNLRISQWVCHCLAGNKHLWTSNIVCV